MSEEQPLLSPDYDIEAGAESRREHNYHARVRDILESQRFHHAVITLIVTDATCVLADLIYTFLSDACEPPGGPDSPAWLEVLANISITIGTFFLIEIPLALWAFGLKYYNPFGRVPHAILHLFDAAIILTTFVLEVVLKGRERELAGLLIVLRLWRLVKLVGGIAVGAGEIEEENAKHYAQCQQTLNATLTELKTAQDECQELRRRVALLEGGG